MQWVTKGKKELQGLDGVAKGYRGLEEVTGVREG